MDVRAYLLERIPLVDAALDAAIPAADAPPGALHSAMRHLLFPGGKRLRPAFAFAACEAVGSDPKRALPAAAAVELIHTYSLVHDDLPAMDDDDLRRGRPTVHRRFGEATAVLAGDALLTLAFEVLGSYPRTAEAASRRGAAVVAAARGAGVAGMVGGQLADLEAENRKIDGDRLRWIHRHKTGALFAASCAIGAIHAGAASACRKALERFGLEVGLAFQIADDLLDRSGSREALGKTPGKDRHSGKATYPALLGEQAARREADERVRDAIRRLREDGPRSPALEALAEFAVARTR